MTDIQAANGATVIDDRARLIHAIYRIALEPRSYDVFMDHWDSHLSQALSELTMLQEGTSLTHPEINVHFDTAFGILQELGRNDITRPTEGEGPRILCDGNGLVVWLNVTAASMFGLKVQSRIDSLDVYSPAHGNCGRMLRDLIGAAPASGDTQRILRLDLPEQTLYLIAQAVNDPEGQRLVLLAPLMARTTPDAERLLQETFGLTAAETAVAAELAEGQRPEQIAARRGVSVLTVRSQIKALQSKTGAAGLVELVRLLLSVGRALDRAETGTRAPAEPTILNTGKGRPIPLELFGSPGGLPVVFLHGMLDGCTLTGAMGQALDRHGLRLIAPVRPGFGTAQPDAGPVQTAPDRLAADLLTVLDRLGLRRVVLLGHMAGSVYAFAAAAVLQERVAGVLSVAGGVPILSQAQFATMSRRQRLVAYTALHAPAALPFVLRAGIRQLDYNGEKAFMTSLYESSPFDLALVSDPEIFRALRLGYQFAVAQGHAAFEIDSHHVVRDWSDRVDASDVPVALVHGLHDPVVSAASVEAFAARLGPRASLTMKPDCGQLVLYRDPDTVFAAAAGLFGHPRHPVDSRPRPMRRARPPA